MEQNNNLMMHGIYVGKEFVKKFQQLDKTTKQPILDLEGKPLLKEFWKLKFKKNPDNQFAVGFGTFDTDAETKYGLVPGEWFTVSYYEKPNAKYPDKPHKNISSAVKGKVPIENSIIPETKCKPLAEDNHAILKEFTEFGVEYLEVVPKEIDFSNTSEKQQVIRNDTHMVGMFLKIKGMHNEMFKLAETMLNGENKP